jgi:hypothetical protein
MKKLFTTLVALAVLLGLSPVPAHGQTKLELGFRGGLNIAGFGGDHSDLWDSKTGLGFGGFLAINVTNCFAIQNEFLYMQKGAKGEDSYVVVEEGIAIQVEEEVTAKLDYLEIPVLAKLTIPTAGNADFYFCGGPAVGINLSAKADQKVTASAMGESFSASREVDIGDVTKSVDFGAVVGAGIGFHVGSSQVFVDGRYTFGLSTIDDSEDDLDIKTRVISIMAGCSFPVGAR